MSIKTPSGLGPGSAERGSRLVCMLFQKSSCAHLRFSLDSCAAGELWLVS